MGSWVRRANAWLRRVFLFRGARNRSLITMAGVSAALAGLLAFSGSGSIAQAAPAASSGHKASSVANAYTFLDMMMDKYATGTTPRLVQSYDGGGVGNLTDS